MWGMKGLIPLSILIFLLMLTLMSIFGDEGYSHLQALRESLDRQNSRNSDRSQYIEGIKNEVYALEKDDRALEKAAREHLGMARPNEEIYFFEEKSNAGR